jgi:hypothetical protein
LHGVIANTDDAADSGQAVGGGTDDLGNRELRLEEGNAPLELRLLLE